MTDESTKGVFRVTIRRTGDLVLRWHATVEHCPEEAPADEIPGGCVENSPRHPLFAFTQAGVERKAQRWIAGYARAQGRGVEVLTIYGTGRTRWNES